MIETIWSLSDDSGCLAGGGKHRVFPDGCIELIFHMAEPFGWELEGGPSRAQPAAFVVGQLSRPMWLIPGPRFKTIGVRFRPSGAYAVLGTDLDALTDSVIPLEALWGRDARRLSEAIGDARTDLDRRRALEHAIATRSRRGHSPRPATSRVTDEILRRRGQVRVDRLARDVGWSERHLERRFVREVGTTPKMLIRTVRFQHLLEAASSVSQDDWAGLAWDCGFSDQAHLIREFRRFTGVTPARLREETLKLAFQFLSPERLRRYFACDPAPNPRPSAAQ